MVVNEKPNLHETNLNEGEMKPNLMLTWFTTNSNISRGRKREREGRTETHTLFQMFQLGEQKKSPKFNGNTDKK